MSETQIQTSLGETGTTVRGRWIAICVIVLATLLGSGVRLHELGDGGAWFDELYTLRDLTSDHTGYSPTRWLGYQPTKIGLGAQGVSPDEIPGGRYWDYQSAGVSMGKARLAACLLGIFTIPLLAWSAWRPLGPGAAALLAVLIALCVWNVNWSQTARFYTQVGLFGGLAVLFYIDAISNASRWRFAASTVMVVLAFLTHPPAILIGGAMVLDAVVQMIRRRPVNYGKWGWSWGIGAIALCSAILAYEKTAGKRGYDSFAGTQQVAQSVPAQSPQMVLVYVFIMLTPVLVFAAWAGLLAGRKHRAVWVLGFAALVPVVAMVGLAAAGGAAHGRYSYVSMIGWLALAAVGLWMMSQALRSRFGPAVSYAPAAIVLVGMLPALGSYLTTGHRFIEPFHLAWRAIADEIEPGDAVFAERYEVAQYELQREEVLPLPGKLSAIDEQAQGREAWIVRLSANSRGRRDWKPVKDPRMQMVFRDAGAVWLPRREVSVYRLTPPQSTPESTPDQRLEVGAKQVWLEDQP